MTSTSWKGIFAFLAMTTALAALGLAWKQPWSTAHSAKLVSATRFKNDPAKYSKAPLQYREFLIHAEAADAIVDPLARCLAFPDLPGNQWSPGIAKATCYSAFGPHITLDQISALLASGSPQELDALYKADLDRHFSQSDFSEVIHSDFSEFNDGERSDRITALWVEKTPGSAYALNARAIFYREKAQTARGKKWISETSPHQIEEMRKYAKISTEFYRRALLIEPRLLPAYKGLITIATLTSQSDLWQEVASAAYRVDPGCQAMAEVEMNALTPRWGGSYEQMQALTGQLFPFAVRRPVLATLKFSPQIDFGDELLHSHNDVDAARVLGPVVLAIPSPEASEKLAWALLAMHKEKHWEALVYLLEASRFWQGSEYSNFRRGELLLMVAERPAWAQKFLKLAIVEDPDDSEAHLFLGSTHAVLKQFGAAASEYQLAMRDEKMRAKAMNEMTGLYLAQHKITQARAEINQVNREYPKFPVGWLTRYCVLRAQKDSGADAALHQYLAVVDPKDPDTHRTMQRYIELARQYERQ